MEIGDLDPDRLGNLSQEGLRLFKNIFNNKISEEQKRRVEETYDFFETFRKLSRKSSFWFELWESGGHSSFREACAVGRSLGIKSKSTIKKYLDEFIELGLAVRHSNGRYQMLGPKWLEKR